MRQNEQNVRTRDKQVAKMFTALEPVSNFWRAKDPDGKQLREYLEACIITAEARGAAEQRRKDAEIAGYLSLELATVLRRKFPGAAVTLSAHKTHTRDIPVYYSPPNVAALEAEIADLKKALRHVTWTASEYGLGKIGHESAVNRARAALTREGGV